VHRLAGTDGVVFMVRGTGSMPALSTPTTDVGQGRERSLKTRVLRTD